MLQMEIVEKEFKGSNIIKIDDEKFTVSIKIHNFEKTLATYSVLIEWRGDEIKIKATKEAMEIIKTTLIKRDTPSQLIWSLIQHEYRVIDRIEDKVERLQNASLHTYSSELIRDVLNAKKTLFRMHRDYLKTRNIIEALIDEGLSSSGLQESLRDVNELIYGVEYLIDATAVALQLMQNTLSYRINKSMNLLTLIATIMMPLTLITGIYGMNFRNMPEIYWEYGYYYSLLLMLTVALLMIYYFKKKRLF